MRRLTALLAFLALCVPAFAATVRVKDDRGLAQALARARAGTTILLAAGEYRGGLSAAGLAGTERAPVVIAGANPEEPPVIRGGASGLHLSGAAHVELRDLVFVGATGNGLNIDDGKTIESPAHHVTLRRITVRDVGPRGNKDGIKLSGVDEFLLEDCTLLRWGDTGSGVDMVGCHRGEIIGCRLSHEAAARGSGIQAKGGCREVAIRRCRFEDAGGRAVNLGGSTGRPYFRPPAPGYEAKDLLVEDCLFIGSQAPIAFVGVEGAVVRHNTIYRPGKWVARILQESTGEEFAPCRNGRFSQNLVVFRSTEVRTAVNVGAGTEPESFVFERNFWFCEDAPGRSHLPLPVEEQGGVYGKDPRLADPDEGDFRVPRGSPARGFGQRSE